VTALDVHALGGAYTLDAVSEGERATFERHLPGCDTCRAQVAELRETAGRLADAAWSVPPPAMRDQVLARMRRTRQERPRVGAEPVPRRTGWTRRAALAAAAVAVAAGGGASGYLSQLGRLGEQRHAAARARANAAAVAAVLSAPDVRLRSFPAGDRGHLNLAYSASRDSVVALLAGVPDPGPAHGYRLWLVRRGTATPAGLLPPGEAVAARLRGTRSLAVTLEPAGGSRTPTPPEIARGEVS
jgi:anti-sigma-K factor RskA